MRRLRLGIIGLNTQGQEHLAAALRHPAVDVTAVCDADSAKVVATAMRLGPNVATFSDFASLFDSGVVDAVIVAVPHDLHFEITQVAARHRVHLLKEKPIGRNLREAQAIAGIARRAGIVLQTGVQRRRHVTYEILREHLRERRNRVISASVEMTVKGDVVDGVVRPSGWRGDYVRSGGGIIIDLGYHAIDLVQYLLGPLDLVSATLWDRGVPTPAGIVENQAAIIGVAGRAWFRIHIGRTGEKRESVVIDCEDGRYEATRASVAFDGETIGRGDAGWEKAQFDQIDTFVKAICGGGAPEPDVDGQVPVIRLIEACYAESRLAGVVGDAGASS